GRRGDVAVRSKLVGEVLHILVDAVDRRGEHDRRHLATRGGEREGAVELESFTILAFAGAGLDGGGGDSEELLLAGGPSRGASWRTLCANEACRNCNYKLTIADIATIMKCAQSEAGRPRLSPVQAARRRTPTSRRFAIAAGAANGKACSKTRGPPWDY